ncbi:MAG: dTDP-4-dehydrorhamnose 3,5-epimerase [Deltaproteobacteria bacterium]|nr:dTDP-4-dehydrorhamnose 3,5-epimerase [Deltaproteobacteria bacterium]
MKFIETPLKKAFVVEVEPAFDDRGFFARSWCHEEFSKHGLNADLVQCNISFNLKKGVLRGMHYQAKPHEEAKLVRCTQGGIYDVIIDLRPESSTYKKWFSVELTGENRKMLYIPEGFSHGFQTLTDNAEVFYQMSTLHHPESACGIRWNDPTFKVKWPTVNDLIISSKDQNYPDFK